MDSRYLRFIFYKELKPDGGPRPNEGRRHDFRIVGYGISFKKHVVRLTRILGVRKFELYPLSE